jgi:hypothetical protein
VVMIFGTQPVKTGPDIRHPRQVPQHRSGSGRELSTLGVAGRVRGATQRDGLRLADMAKKFTVQIYCKGAAPKTATGTAGTLTLSDVADFATK